MGWFDDLWGGVKNVATNLFDNSIGSSIVKTIITGYALNKITSSINKGNDASTAATSTPTVDSGSKLQIPAAGENRIPVVYGQAVTGGIITDVKMSTDNQTMWYVVTICEVTGALMSTGQPSQISFEDVYINGNRIVFKTTGNDAGIVADYVLDADGNQDTSISGLVNVYCYNNGSFNPVVPDNYTNANGLVFATTLMPDWTSSHTMDELVFAVVKVTYNKDKGMTGMPNMSFAVKNSLTLPGDVLFDYMTNTRYGAGIDSGDIKSA